MYSSIVELERTLNISEEFHGMQLGLVNVNEKKAHGMQIGLVNYTEDIDGIPIGLVSIVKNGTVHGEVWFDDTMFYNASLKHGTKHFYTVYNVGINNDVDLATVGLGWGGHLPFWRFYIDIDIIGSVLLYTGENSYDDAAALWRGQARLTLGFSIFKRLSLFVGASYNYCNDNPGGDISMLESLSGKIYKISSYGGTSHYHWPGFYFGVKM